MNRKNEFLAILGNTIRVIPSFAILSIIGCALAHYAFSVPMNQLAVVVSVPLVGIFAISRLLRIAVPPTQTSSERATIPPFVMFFSLVAFVSGLLAIDFVLSVPVFLYLDVPHEIVGGTLTTAGVCGILAVGNLVIASIIVMREVIAKYATPLRAGVWRILSYPTRVADNIFPHLHHKM